MADAAGRAPVPIQAIRIHRTGGAEQMRLERIELPPPLFNELFAMLMRVPEFKLEGDTLLAVQNARALQRFMSLMRGAESAR